MFEKHQEQILSRKQYLRRQLKFLFYTMVLMSISLGVGVVGYMLTAGLAFEDALLNASMILTGMGPVNVMDNSASKYFASFYALYSGVAFLTMMSVLLAPALHRFLHKMRIQN